MRVVGWGVMENYKEAKDETRGKGIHFKSNRLYVDKPSTSVLQWAVKPIRSRVTLTHEYIMASLLPSDHCIVLKGEEAS